MSGLRKTKIMQINESDRNIKRAFGHAHHTGLSATCAKSGKNHRAQLFHQRDVPNGNSKVRIITRFFSLYCNIATLNTFLFLSLNFLLGIYTLLYDYSDLAHMENDNKYTY